MLKGVNACNILFGRTQFFIWHSSRLFETFISQNMVDTEIPPKESHLSIRVQHQRYTFTTKMPSHDKVDRPIKHVWTDWHRRRLNDHEHPASGAWTPAKLLWKTHSAWWDILPFFPDLFNLSRYTIAMKCFDSDIPLAHHTIDTRNCEAFPPWTDVFRTDAEQHLSSQSELKFTRRVRVMRSVFVFLSCGTIEQHAVKTTCSEECKQFYLSLQTCLIISNNSEFSLPGEM